MTSTWRPMVSSAVVVFLQLGPRAAEVLRCCVGRRASACAVVAVVAMGAACSNARTAPAAQRGGAVQAAGPPSPRADVTTACPVTAPSTPAFVPPVTHPAKPTGDQRVWYGTPRLWTVLDVGEYRPRKSVWWSAEFAAGASEPKPEISVTWQRLDRAEPARVQAAPGTNAHTDEDGWFMIAGIDPDEPGCWRVTATYRGATLSYTYLRR